MCFQVCAILTLQEAAEVYLVGLLDDTNHSCEIYYPYAQGYTISLAYPWRTPSLFNILLPKSVLVFLLVVGCVGFCQYQGRELILGLTLYI